MSVLNKMELLLFSDYCLYKSWKLNQAQKAASEHVVRVTNKHCKAGKVKN